MGWSGQVIWSAQMRASVTPLLSSTPEPRKERTTRCKGAVSTAWALGGAAKGTGYLSPEAVGRCVCPAPSIGHRVFVARSSRTMRMPGPLHPVDPHDNRFPASLHTQASEVDVLCMAIRPGDGYAVDFPVIGDAISIGLRQAGSGKRESERECRERWLYC